MPFASEATIAAQTRSSSGTNDGSTSPWWRSGREARAERPVDVPAGREKGRNENQQPSHLAEFGAHSTEDDTGEQATHHARCERGESLAVRLDGDFPDGHLLP